MRTIMYITSTLPAVTMTFVYREIQILMKVGYTIITVSRGTPDKEEISAEALPFYESTLYLDQVRLTTKLFAQLKVLISVPLKLLFLVGLILQDKQVKTFRDLPRSLYHLLEAGYLYTQLKNNRLNHIHAHLLDGPTSIAMFLSYYLDIQFSFTMHASNIFLNPLMLETKLLRCKKAVTVSKYNKKILLEIYGNHFSEKIEVIHCGIDVDAFKPQNRRKNSLPIILAVGQLVERKGFRYLLEACRLLRDRDVDFQCQIVGAGEEMALLTQISATNKLNDSVRFLGAQPQERVKRLLQEAMVFVLPAIVTDRGGREGIPVALMEAMAMGIPVISTKTVGMPELIQDKKEGLLINEKNASELASAIEFLLKNPVTRKKMGHQGRIKVIAEFNIRDIPDLFYSVFN